MESKKETLFEALGRSRDAMLNLRDAVAKDLGISTLLDKITAWLDNRKKQGD